MRFGPHTDSARVVTQALSFQAPDRLPVFDGFWGGFEERWRRERRPAPDEGIEEYYWIDLKVPVANEAFFPSRMGVVRQDGADVYRDDGWGRIIRTRPGTYFMEPVEHVLREPADLDRLRFEPADLDSRYDALLAAVERQRGLGRAVFVKIGGPYIRSSFLRGEEDLLADMAADKGFARALIARVADHLLQVGLESLRRAGTHDFGVWIYDDMCSRRGPVFSPKTFEEILLPAYRHLVGSLKAAGARWVVFHSDGNLTPLLDLLIAAGIDGVNPVEHGAGMDAVDLLRRYHGRLFFIGGVCNTHILPRGDVGEIRRHVAALVEAGRHGGLVIGTHSVGPDISTESYEAYREVVAGG